MWLTLAPPRLVVFQTFKFTWSWSLLYVITQVPGCHWVVKEHNAPTIIIVFVRSSTSKILWHMAYGRYLAVNTCHKYLPTYRHLSVPLPAFSMRWCTSAEAKGCSSSRYTCRYAHEYRHICELAMLGALMNDEENDCIKVWEPRGQLTSCGIILYEFN